MYLAAYDDSALSRRRRRRLTALLRDSPEARAELDRQRAVRDALAGFAAEAPAPLRAEIERLRASPRPRRKAVPRAALATGVASLFAALVVAIALFPAGATTVEAMAALAHSPATAPAPRPAALDSPLLDRSFAGVDYPNWQREFGWRAEGARTDTVAGRRTSTVFYLHDGHRLAYTVADGAPLAPPEDAQQVTANGVTAHFYRDGDHSVVMFERNGHTCVLAGHVVHESTALKLATWNGRDALRF